MHFVHLSFEMSIASKFGFNGLTINPISDHSLPDDHDVSII